MTQGKLEGQRVLILEDEYLIALDTVDAVTDAGGSVIGPFASENEAFEDILEQVPTVAILDVGLDGKQCFDVARVLHYIGVPFVFVTGYSRASIPPDLLDVPHFTKPLGPEGLVDAIAKVVA